MYCCNFHNFMRERFFKILGNAPPQGFVTFAYL